MSVSGFKRRSLAEQVADELRLSLASLDGHARRRRRRMPSVRELARQFDVSTQVANAALRLLADDRMVQVVPRQGTFLMPADDQRA